MEATNLNRLAKARSPYLQQHADNPVDWYEWGEEALAKAKAENKPLIISIGYAACHWCHVMAHESFSDPKIAEVMNRHFVCIKVDREERPDGIVALPGEGRREAARLMNRGHGRLFGHRFSSPQKQHRCARVRGSPFYS